MCFYCLYTIYTNLIDFLAMLMSETETSPHIRLLIDSTPQAWVPRLSQTQTHQLPGPVRSARGPVLQKNGRCVSLVGITGPMYTVQVGFLTCRTVTCLRVFSSPPHEAEPAERHGRSLREPARTNGVRGHGSGAPNGGSGQR